MQAKLRSHFYGHEELGSVSFESIGDLLAYEINIAWAADESKGPGSMSPEGLKQIPPSYVTHLNVGAFNDVVVIDACRWHL